MGGATPGKNARDAYKALRSVLRAVHFILSALTEGRAALNRADFQLSHPDHATVLNVELKASRNNRDIHFEPHGSFRTFNDYETAADALVLMHFSGGKWNYWCIPLRGRRTRGQREFLELPRFQRKRERLESLLGSPLTRPKLRAALLALF